MHAIESIEEKPHDDHRLYLYYQQVVQAALARRQQEEQVHPAEKAENGPQDDEKEDHLAGKRDDRPARDLQSNPAGAEVTKIRRQVHAQNDVKRATLADKRRREQVDSDLIRRLQERDLEVHRHEQSHAAALGPDAGLITYTYQVGPDGRAYAIGGTTEVEISTELSPEATREKARRLRAAALAAAEPSIADMAVAAAANAMENKALAEIRMRG